MSVKFDSPKRGLLKRAWAIILASGFYCLSTPAFACQLEAQSAPSAPRIDYDVYDLARAIGATQFDLHNSGDMDCALEIIVSDLTDFPPPFEFPAANVSIDIVAPGLQGPTNTTQNQGIFLLNLLPGASQMVTLDFFTDQSISVPAGTYRKDIKIGVRLAGAIEPLDEFVTDLTLIFASQAQINIAGADGIFDKATYADSIDFGEAEVGKSRRVFVQTHANAVATMTLESENGGKMVHGVTPMYPNSPSAYRFSTVFYAKRSFR